MDGSTTRQDFQARSGVDPDHPYGTPRRPAGFWIGLALPPLVWVVHHQLSYGIASLRCSSAGAILPVLTVILFAAAIAGGVLIWRARTRLYAESPELRVGDQPGVNRFLVHVAMFSAGLFALAILAQSIPLFILDPCA